MMGVYLKFIEPQTRKKCSIASFMELQYTDEKAFVAHNRVALQIVLIQAVQAYSNFGLMINRSKTEIVFQPRPEAILGEPLVLQIDGTELQAVNHVKYIGSYL